MDMKRILQALDGASSKPVEGADSMKKFLQVVTEGANPHKVSLPVQMAMQHYQAVEPAPVVERKPSLINKYFHEIEQEIAEQHASRRQLIKQYSQTVAERVMMREGAEVFAERSSTGKQARTMAAAAHNPEFAQKVGIKQSVAKEFNQKDKGTALLSNAMKGKKKVKENEISGHSMGFTGGVGPGMGNYVVDESPLDFDKENPSSSTIHSHQGVNPASIEARIMRARGQLKELAKSAESNELIVWESIARHFPELAMNIEQIRHGIDELANIRKGGGRRVHNIPKDIGENVTKTIKPKKKTDPCWNDYHQVGTKIKNGQSVPNCVPKK